MYITSLLRPKWYMFAELLALRDSRLMVSSNAGRGGVGVFLFFLRIFAQQDPENLFVSFVLFTALAIRDLLFLRRNVLNCDFVIGRCRLIPHLALQLVFVGSIPNLSLAEIRFDLGVVSYASHFLASRGVFSLNSLFFLSALSSFCRQYSLFFFPFFFFFSFLSLRITLILYLIFDFL